MTDWWTEPYKGGPMVPLPGFPRPLYPPDAASHGKQPSGKGPDVEAYKRTVSRAGRWPWQPFDRAYSNAFSHGDGPNVADTGIAGIQRQQHLDATGWIGERTFNTLRSIRCPKGPHEGEMAMDAYAAELLEQAWSMFHGHEPEPDPGNKTTRLAALNRALGEIGYKESPAGSNQTKYGSAYGMNGQPWCAMFLTWCYEEAGGSPSFAYGSYYAYCPFIVSDAQYGRNGLSITQDPIPGDLVLYDWYWDTVYDHCGLFDCWASGTSFFAVEGNTSPDDTGDQSNGGMVVRKKRDRQAQGTVFVRVSE